MCELEIPERSVRIVEDSFSLTDFLIELEVFQNLSDVQGCSAGIVGVDDSVFGLADSRKGWVANSIKHDDEENEGFVRIDRSTVGIKNWGMGNGNDKIKLFISNFEK